LLVSFPNAVLGIFNLSNNLIFKND
jgi:hypothetical protein